MPITQALDAPVSCARVQPTVPFPSGPSGTRLASLPALGREQPVSDDQRVSVPSHPDLGASALHWEQVLRRVCLEGESGLAERMEWPWYLAQPCGFLWQLGGFDCTLGSSGFEAYGCWYRH